MSHCVVHDTSELAANRNAAGPAATSGRADLSARETESQLACAALELVTTLIESKSIDEAATRAVHHLKVFLNADGVAMGTPASGGGCRLAAITGTADNQAGSAYATAITTMLAEVIDNRRAQPAVNSRPGGCDPAGSFRRFGRGTRSPEMTAFFDESEIAAVRLETQSGTTVGALLLWGANSDFRCTQAERFLRLSSEPLAAAFHVLGRTKTKRLQSAIGRALGGRRCLVCAVLLVIAASLLLAIPYRVACECVAEPLAQRFICAPFEGVFQKSMVRPGDSVREGQILGQMDSHDLSIQLAAITADSERMRKSYDVNLASGKVAAAQIDRLELERLEQQKGLLEHRMSNLAIRSPVEGYVIGGDLKRKEGSPLTLGQVLYEIAPLDQMCVELSIDQSDIASVEMGQEVSIWFEAWGGESLVGHVARIHPRSEIRESRNVFVAEVVLADSNEQLRPGMRGEARIAVAGENMATAIGRRWWHRLASYWGF